MRSPSLSVSGRSRRWKLLTLACTQPARSVTRARAGPARLRSPVASATSSSASAVASSKSAWSECGQVGGGERLAPAGPDRDPLGELPVDRTVASRRSVVAAVSGRLRLAQEGDDEPDRDQHDRDEDEHTDPVVPHGRREHASDCRPPPRAVRIRPVSRAARAGGPLRCGRGARAGPCRGSAAARTGAARRRSRRARRRASTRRGAAAILARLLVVDLPREQVVDLVQRLVALRLERGGVGGHGV